MIKILLTTSLAITLILSCHSNSSTENKKEEEKKVSKRNYAIKASNAYNNIFFDSLQLSKFISSNKISDSIGRRMISFYNTRNYQFAWFGNNGLTEQAIGFWNLHNYQTTYGSDSTLFDKALEKSMNAYTGETDGFPVAASDPAIVTTELKLTSHFIQYMLTNVADGYVKRKEMERFIPISKNNTLSLADSLISKKHKDNKYYENINESYGLLKNELVKYVQIAKAGGWVVIEPAAKKIKKGTSSELVVQLKRRLHITGDMNADTTNVFNNVLDSGIRHFQVRCGYKPTGILTDELIRDMNVPVEYRIRQLLVNMGRMQWMINEPAGQIIVVNIPEFILHVKEGKSKLFDMDVVVGKEGHNTMMFTGNLNQVVFSPYWNLPESIVRKEILPSMQKNKNYLANHNMEITGKDGDIPVIRQLPGGDNSLGKVKFLFPNSYNIYFHDTPAKSLFGKDKRAYSHGCIRLSDPKKMAEYLLKGDSKWDSESIDSAMNTGKEKYVKLKKAVPVLITYYTAWVDDDGLLHFADDIYGHDKEVMEKMFVDN